MSNYATKSDLKNATNVDTSELAKKTNLANLKSEADKLAKSDACQLKLASADLKKLNDVVDNINK